MYCTCINALFVNSDCVMHLIAITRPPENKTVCRGSNVTISCGYLWSSVLPVTWIINGMSFTQIDSPLYQLNNPTSTMALSLTVVSINSNTTFQCIVHSITNLTSTLGKVTVTSGKYVNVHICKIIAIL